MSLLGQLLHVTPDSSNVGIGGVIDPLEKLHVDGNIRIDNGQLEISPMPVDPGAEILKWEPGNQTIGYDLAEVVTLLLADTVLLVFAEYGNPVHE